MIHRIPAGSRRWSARKRTGELLDITDQEFGLLKGCKMTAPIELCPMCERRQYLFREPAHRPNRILRE